MNCPFGGFACISGMCGCVENTDQLPSATMLSSALVMLVALNRQPAQSALVTHPIVCAANADVSDSGCGNTGTGNSGTGNSGTGNSGTANVGVANSGLANIGTANSGAGNVGTGNSGCGNTGTANSGGGNVGTGNSGGFSCAGFTPPTTPVTVTSVPGGVTTIPTATAGTPVPVATLPLTGRNSSEPVTLALGLLLTGAAAVGLANRRRHNLAVVNGGEVVPLASAVGLLLTGRAKASDSPDKRRS